MNKIICFLLLTLIFFINVNVKAQKIYRYGELPKNAAEPSTFQNFKPINSTELGFTFRFEKQSNIPLLKKSSRILAKEIAVKVVASEPLSPAELWEARLKTLRTLDLEAEKYLTEPVPATETKKVSE